MYATRSRTAAANSGPKANPVLPVKVQRKAMLNMVDKNDCKLAKQCQLEEREKALAEREKALAERKKALAKREKELVKREKALEKALETTPKKSKKFSAIYYTDKYRDCDPEFEKIGEFADEKSAIVGVITWLIQNSKGGFDVWDLNQLLEDRNECEEMNEEEIIQYMTKKCKTWNDLRAVCADYGNSYFEENDGWFLKKT